MKAPQFFKSTQAVLLTAVLASVTFLSACNKDDDSDNLNYTGSTSINIANAVEGSQPQDFYLNNIKINTTAVAYAQSSGYLATNAGQNLQAEFRASGSTGASVSLPSSLEANKYYTFYFTSDGSTTTAVATEDDRAIPSSGKAKIRFVQLSSAYSGIDVTSTSAIKLVTALQYKSATTYSEIDPALTLQIFPAGSTTAVLSIPTLTLQAGKNYTVLISGKTNLSIAYQLLVNN